MKSYKASDLFTVKTVPQATFPLNLEFETKAHIPDEFNMSGLYMMFFKQQLIYIGSADKEPTLNRFKAQLSTITLRGRHVSFNTSSEEAVLKSIVLSHDFDKSILSINAERFETSPKRIAFAEKNWSLFSRLDQALLNHFVFVWFPYNQCFIKSLPEICNDWKRNLKPICNG